MPFLSTASAERLKLIAARDVSRIPSGNGRRALPYFFHADWAKPAERVGRRIAS
jgi:hypothetical protein